MLNSQVVLCLVFLVCLVMENALYSQDSFEFVEMGVLVKMHAAWGRGVGGVIQVGVVRYVVTISYFVLGYLCVECIVRYVCVVILFYGGD